MVPADEQMRRIDIGGDGRDIGRSGRGPPEGRAKAASARPCTTMSRDVTKTFEITISVSAPGLRSR